MASAVRGPGLPGPGRRLKPDGRPIRVLQLITRLNVGGPARHVVWISEGMRSFGYETAVLAGRPEPGEDDLSEFAREKRIEIHDVPDLTREIHPVRDLLAFRRLRRKILELDPDIVHTHMSKAGLLGRWTALRVRRARRRDRLGFPRTVHTFHGHVLSGYFSPAKERVFRAVERALGESATDAAIVLSPQQREEIVERHAVVPAGKVFVIPLGLDLSDFEELPARGRFRQEIGVAAGDFVFGIVGRIAPIKNQELFLRAAAIMARQHPRARFVVVGGGPGLDELRRAAARLEILDRVRFAGIRRDLPSVYADLDAIVLSSLNEGTPLSLLEGMACGLPVAATDVGGVRDLLTKEWAGDITSRSFRVSESARGLLTASGDADALAAALSRLAGEALLARELGNAGRDYVFRHHGLPRFLADIDRLYRLVLGE
jgi:glycosyltransferase involved in cell wall biosynthesis